MTHSPVYLPNDSVPTAKVILDSISPQRYRLITVEARIHRFVLAELNTHRVFSRNSASSRAIPVKKMMDSVANDPAMPMWWGKTQKGMAASEEVSPEVVTRCREMWICARDSALRSAKILLEDGLHKQIVNRLLEPFAWHTVIISSTCWANFFRQRCHPAAMPEMRAAAEAIRDAISASSPTLLRTGEWHMPYFGSQYGDDVDALKDPAHGRDFLEHAKKLSVARCARVSYLTHDGVRDTREDHDMYTRLATADVPHASPFEHVATPWAWSNSSCGNFWGWRQMRHVVFEEDQDRNEFYELPSGVRIR